MTVDMNKLLCMKIPNYEITSTSALLKMMHNIPVKLRTDMEMERVEDKTDFIIY